MCGRFNLQRFLLSHHARACGASPQGVRGFPTIKLYGPELKSNPYTGKPYKEFEE